MTTYLTKKTFKSNNSKNEKFPARIKQAKLVLEKNA